ncbi:MAG: response regulator [Blastocatellia bacterium]
MDEKQRTILIVDDTPEDRAICRRYLQRDHEWRYHILEAETGDRALEIYAEQQPDCVLLDYGLPDMTGLELLAALAGELDEDRCPAVMLTGANEVELAVAALKAGAQDFINKDRLTPLDLRHAVHNAIERVALRRELQEREEMFRATFDQAAVGIAHVRPDGRLLRVNQTLCNLLGYERAELLEHTFQELTYPADRAADLALMRRLLAAEIPSYTLETRYVRKQGSLVWVSLTASCVRDRAGAVKYVVGIVEDITARKEIEIERERLIERERAARETAEAHNRAKDDFLSVVTHELRSPLNAILGYTRLARSGAADPDQVRQHCDIIERAARTQQRLIDDLLDTARIITGKLRIDALPCDLRLVLEEALAVVQPAADAKGIALIARLGPLRQMVVGDPARLQQIVWNLLQNAIKFTPAAPAAPAAHGGGRVELQVEPVGDQVHIVVADNGKGIEPEFLPAVFDRFSQNDMSRTRRHGGLGLGLALVKQLVELHGGEIEAASEGAGRGAAFTVRLPRRAPQVEIPRPVRAVSTEVHMGEDALSLDGLPSLAGVTVLAVDDQEEARHLIAEALKGQGATITTVSSGAEALAFLAGAPAGAKPDVLILDIAMPDEDGYNVLRRVRALETESGLQAIPAIALTSHTGSQDRLAALSAGFQMHVGKPVELAELVLVIGSLIGGKRKGAPFSG